MEILKKMSILIFFLFFSCSDSQEKIDDGKDKDKDKDELPQNENLSIEKKFDVKSATYYYLTRINHKDKNGNLLKLQIDHQIKQNGETVVEFAKRMGNPMLAMNASMGLSGLGPDKKQVAGRQIVDGVIVQERTSRNYTLGIKDDNELLAYPPNMTAHDILHDGTKNALTGFVPLIQNHQPVGDDILGLVGNNAVKHPRQVIAQFANLDLLVLSCGGRGFDGEGMTAKDLIRVLKENNVKFAFNLDGGGSVTTVIEGVRITKQIDGNGTKDRPRSNFLYIK